MARVGDPERDGGRADCDGRVTTLALPVLLYTPPPCISLRNRNIPRHRPLHTSCCVASKEKTQAKPSLPNRLLRRCSEGLQRVPRFLLHPRPTCSCSSILHSTWPAPHPLLSTYPRESRRSAARQLSTRVISPTDIANRSDAKTASTAREVYPAVRKRSDCSSCYVCWESWGLDPKAGDGPRVDRALACTPLPASRAIGEIGLGLGLPLATA